MKMKLVLVVLPLLLVGCAGVYRYDTHHVTAYGGKLGTGNEPLCSHCEGKRFQPPLIGRADSDTAYSLPLTENQL